MSRNFTPKPAYNALKDVPGTGGCSYEASPADPDPEPSDEPGSREDEPGDDPAVRSSPMLKVTRAWIRRGRLTIAGRVASGVPGKIRGRAHVRGGRRFTLPIDGQGRFRIDTRLRGARRASSARVTLSYRGTRRFLSQGLTLKVGRTSAQLRVLKAA